MPSMMTGTDCCPLWNLRTTMPTLPLRAALHSLFATASIPELPCRRLLIWLDNSGVMTLLDAVEQFPTVDRYEADRQAIIVKLAQEGRHACRSVADDVLQGFPQEGVDLSSR